MYQFPKKRIEAKIKGFFFWNSVYRKVNIMDFNILKSVNHNHIDSFQVPQKPATFFKLVPLNHRMFPKYLYLVADRVNTGHGTARASCFVQDISKQWPAGYYIIRLNITTLLYLARYDFWTLRVTKKKPKDGSCMHDNFGFTILQISIKFAFRPKKK